MSDSLEDFKKRMENINDDVKRTQIQNRTVKSNECPQVRPWVRFFARALDIFFWGNIVFLIWVLFSPKTYNWVNSFLWGVLIGVITYALWIFVEAFLLSTLGYTLGKWLLNVRVRNSAGDKLTYSQALKRTFLVWIFGEGFVYPYITFVTNILSYSYLTRKGKTKWDMEGKNVVSHTKLAPYKIIISLIISIAMPLLLNFIIKPSI